MGPAHFGPQYGGVGYFWGQHCVVLGYTGMTGRAPELYWAILAQCQSCRESNTRCYWDSSEVYWHTTTTIVGQCQPVLGLHHRQHWTRLE